MEIPNLNGVDETDFQWKYAPVVTIGPAEFEMAQQADLSLNDGQSTPVAHTFSARGANAQLAKWMDTSGGIGVGVPVITLGNSKPQRGPDGSYKVEMRISLPILETISGSDGGYTPRPKIAYSLLAKVELIAPDRSTLDNRKDLLAYARNLLATSVAGNAFLTWDIPL